MGPSLPVATLKSLPPYFNSRIAPSITQPPYAGHVETSVPSVPVPGKIETPAAVKEDRQAKQTGGAYGGYQKMSMDISKDHLGSTYIPLDSWVYPALTRLYSLGYVDTMFLGMRPWTRRSVLHMLQQSQDAIFQDGNEQATTILEDMRKELSDEIPDNNAPRNAVFGLYSGYTRLMGIGGETLRDSYHLGQTINNDYGRPYSTGFNNVTGFSAVNELGRFSLYVRGEYQHSPGRTGYPFGVAVALANPDAIPYNGFNVPQDTIPAGNLPAKNPFRLVEATISYHLLGHEISAGKSDAWLGPAQGGAMAWSNNAENIYSFRINRVEPMYIPLVRRVLGPLRYDFFYGSLKGHTYPNSPYTHSVMFSFRPTSNFEFGFQRTVIFGGKGHSPVTIHTFLKSFFSISDTTAGEKFSREDPGARFSDFNFSYRLPFVRKYATLYVDSIAHDDVTPVSAPRRAAFRTGLYLSQIPGMRKLNLRAEAVTTDPPTSRSVFGSFNYYETIQRQGYTNKGYIMGDWIGREAKGGQAWLTYHLNGQEWVELEYLNKKNAKDFVGGTTQNQVKLTVVKRLRPELEMNAWYQYERWKAPIYKAGPNSNSVVAVQFTWFPALHSKQLSF